METPPPGEGHAFPSTSWTLILRARGEGPEARASMNQLLALYWRPVFCHVRANWRCSDDDAKDLTQDFFAVFLERDLLNDIREERPRFRAFLRRCLENFLLSAHRDRARLKRGGGAQRIPIEADAVAAVEDGADPPEEVFDRAWARTVLEGCLAALETIYTTTGRATYWEVFARHDLASGEPPSYEECARAAGVTRDDVKNYLRHARRTLRRLAREQVRETLVDSADLDSELDALSRLA